LEKLKQAIKEAEESKKSQQKSSGPVDNKDKHSKNKTAKQNYITSCGLRVKSSKQGVIIEAILTGSRANQVGLQPGDIIEVIDGRTIKKEKELEEMLQSKPFGQRFQLLVVRRGQTGQILF
jgi:S1-C subfamily serine protease